MRLFTRRVTSAYLERAPASAAWVRVGERVGYSRAFLSKLKMQDGGMWHARGEVLRVDGGAALVRWDGMPTTSWANAVNLLPEARCDTLSHMQT